jgi:hypothetical protein
MADALTEIDLDDLHDAIETQIAAAFPTLQTVEFYREDRKTVVAPACLLELVEFETAGAEPDPGTGQLAMLARFEAELILGFRTANAKREARKLAANLAAFLHLRRWTGIVTGPGEVVGCYKDDFAPELDQFEVWRVEWSHIIHLGQSVWVPDGSITPTTVYSRGTNPEGAEFDEPEEVTP